MKNITFTPTGFKIGNSYTAQLLLNGEIIDTIINLVVNTQYSFTVTVPATYLLKVMDVTDNLCVFSQTVQALFPVTTHSISDVDCNNNTYSYNITITNPTTAGNNVQFGWSTINDCSAVSNWGTNNNLILSADNVVRYVFIRNSGCCNFISSSTKNPCINCTLSVTNISFNCG